MAAPINTSDANLTGLQNQADTVQKSLSSSPTAYAPDTSPSSYDISQSTKLDTLNKNIDVVRSAQLRNEWYGPQSQTTGSQANTASTQTPPATSNWLWNSLSALQKPLNAVAGTAQYLLGKGTSPDYFTSVNNALKTGTEFGSILKQYNVPRPIQIPLGFMLDVFADPVNWLTAGSSTLVGGAAEGLIKGTAEEGLSKGLETAGTSVLGNLQSKAARTLPYLFPDTTVGKIGQSFIDNAAAELEKYKTASAAGEAVGAAPSGTSSLGQGLVNASDKYQGLITDLGESSVANANKIAPIIGDVYSKLGKGLFGSDLNQGKTLGNLIESGIRGLPGGDSFADFMKYSPQQQLEAAKTKDLVSQIADSKDFVLVPGKTKDGIEVPGVIQDVNDLLKGTPAEIQKNVSQVVNEGLKTADQTLSSITASGKFKVADTLENAKTILLSAGQDYSMDNLIRAYRVIPAGKTGVIGYDTFIDGVKGMTMGDVLDKLHVDGLAKGMGVYDKVKDWTPLKNLINVNDAALKLFRIFHVSDAPGMYPFMIGGNMFMLAAGGAPVSDFRLLKEMYSSWQFVKGNQDLEYVKNSFFNDQNTWFDMLKNDPNFFKMVFGFSPKTIGSKVDAEATLLKQFGPNASFDNVASILRQEWENLDISVKNAAKMEGGASPEAVEALKEYRRANAPKPEIQSITELKNLTGGIQGAQAPGQWTAAELYNNDWFDALKQRVAAKSAAATGYAEKGAYGAANLLLNSMPNTYGGIEQGMRLGYANYLTKIGVPEENLLAISRQVALTKADILSPIMDGGVQAYRLTPEKAAEVVGNTFINYAAMPDIVKMMRAMPIVGSPFLSFTYGMGTKTLKTLTNNPEIFNKVAYLIQNISDTKTPAEKDALTQKYNQYLNSPTMIKAWDYMGGAVFTDARGLLPYLTLNMLQPSQKTYASSFPADVIRVIDGSPFMKNPVGQTIFDYFIQPWLLSGSGQIVQNQFGEPLYPAYDAQGKKITPSLATQTGYAARNLGEALVPGITSYTGLLNATGAIPHGVVNAVPSYGFRQVANATQGEDTIGATTKENAMEKTLRALSSRSGIPAFVLNTTALPKSKTPTGP